MSCIQISLEAHIWQAIWTDSTFLANIICSFTKEHFMYIDLLIIINFNTQKCRYVSCGKHKWHVSTNWMWHNITMLVTSHHTCWRIVQPHYIRKYVLMSSTRIRVIWQYLILFSIINLFYFIYWMSTNLTCHPTVYSTFWNHHFPIPGPDGTDIILALWRENDSGQECIQCNINRECQGFCLKKWLCIAFQFC